MAADYRGIRLMKVYAPFGTARMNERERFYNMELSDLLRADPATMILGVISTVYLTPLTRLVTSTSVEPPQRWFTD